MRDKDQITAVLTNYATGIDQRDWTLFRSCFTEDCQCDYSEMGAWRDRESITRYMIHAHSGPSLHRLSNASIHIEGDSANSRVYVDALVTGPKGIGGAQTLGYYEDTWQRRDEGWKISARRFVPVRLKFLGLLGLIPSFLALPIAALASRRMNAALNTKNQNTKNQNAKNQNTNH